MNANIISYRTKIIFEESHMMMTSRKENLTRKMINEAYQNTVRK